LHYENKQERPVMVSPKHP